MTKNKIGMIIIIALLIVMLAGVGVGLFITIRSLNKIAGETGSDTMLETPSYTPEDLVMFTLSKDLKANLLQGNDEIDHLILVEMSLALNSKEKKIDTFISMLSEKETIIRDVALRVLRNKRYEDLKKPNAQQLLADEILTRLQTEFNTNFIVDVYFGEFFLQ